MDVPNGVAASAVSTDPLSLMARRVLILANPRSGSGKSRRLVEALSGALRARGMVPQTCWEREELSAWIARGVDDLRCVVAAGGDGTVQEVVNRAPGVPTAVLPLGNENLVARYCGYSRSPQPLAEAIAMGQVRQLDLAKAGGRRFCVMAGAGFDAEVVHRVHRRRRGHVTKFAYVFPVLQALTLYPAPPIQVEIPETGEQLRGALAFVFNLPPYALNLPLAADARPDDGRLDLYLFARHGPLRIARYVTAILRGRQHLLADYQHRVVQSVRLTSEGTVPLQIDGDPAGKLPVTVEVVPAALRMIVA
jgi:diacylglycerol kinase family enzyme